MELGTIVYDHEIYNLDYMTSEEILGLLQIVEQNKTRDTIILSSKLKSVYTNRVSEEEINQKVNHQLNSMKTSILNINTKFTEKSKNYDKVNDEMLDALKRFEEVLKQLADSFDSRMQQLIYKQLELEAKLLGMIAKNQKEEKSKKRKKEEQEDEVSNEIIKLRKEIKVIIKKQKSLAEKKKNEIFSAMEVGNKEITVGVKKRRKIKNIAKLFSYKFNTYKVILKNVIEPVNQRIDEFKVNRLKKVDGKSKEFNFAKIETKINEIVENYVEEKDII